MEVWMFVVLAIVGFVALITLPVLLALSESKNHERAAAEAKLEGREYTLDKPVMATHTPGEVITYGGSTAFGDAAWKVVGPVFEPIIDAIMRPKNKR